MDHDSLVIRPEEIKMMELRQLVLDWAITTMKDGDLENAIRAFNFYQRIYWNPTALTT